MPDNISTYQNCHTAVNMEVYRGFHCQEEDVPYLSSHMGLFIFQGNTYICAKSEIKLVFLAETKPLPFKCFDHWSTDKKQCLFSVHNFLTCLSWSWVR